MFRDCSSCQVVRVGDWSGKLEMVLCSSQPSPPAGQCGHPQLTSLRLTACLLRDSWLVRDMIINAAQGHSHHFPSYAPLMNTPAEKTAGTCCTH